MPLRPADIAPLLVLVCAAVLWPGAARAGARVPVVGCRADGMAGPAQAPDPLPPAPPVPAGAEALAFYAAPGLAVLAPRGWHCRETYGSGGAALLVTPGRYTADTLPGFGALAGPAVELSFLSGENSGREDVADVLARLFPARRRPRAAAADEPDRPHRRPRGPFPGDRTLRRGPAVADYTTPPHRDGMGTFDSRLGPGDRPIDGTAVLDRSDGVESVVLLDVRLPPRLRRLAPVILRAARRRTLNRAGTAATGGASGGTGH